ncbi:MAG: acyl-CoA dehydrogenase family protein [Betaproteobacteria bacterium]
MFSSDSLLNQTKHFVENHLEPLIKKDALDLFSGKTLLATAASYGLLGIQVSVALGGQGLPFSAKARIAEAVSAHDFGVAMSLVNTHNVAEQIARIGNPILKQRHLDNLISGKKSACTALTETAVGSDFSAIQTTASRMQGGWELNGTKAWITNAVHADLMVVYAQTQAGAGASGIAAFVIDVEKTGFNRLDSHTSPIASIGAGAFSLSGYQCDDDDMLSPPGEAFKDILQAINGARIYVSAMCCGMVQTCLSIATAYGAQRQTFGKPLLSHQGWRWQLSDAAVELEAARSMVNAAASLIDEQQDAQSMAAKTKIFASRMAQKQIAILMHAMGAEGLSAKHPFMRHLAAAQIAGMVDGATEMLLERVAKDFR